MFLCKSAIKHILLGTRSFGAYAQKMLIAGYIIKVNYFGQRKLAAEINKIDVNILSGKTQEQVILERKNPLN